MNRLLVFLLGLSFLPACQNRPTAAVTGVRVSRLTIDRIELKTDIKVTNPLAVPLPLLDFRHRLEADGRVLFSTTIQNPQWSVAAHSNRVVQGSGELRFQNVLATIGMHFPKGTEVPYRSTTELSWRSPVGDTVAFPSLVAAGEFPIPRLPEVSLRQLPELGIELGSLDNPFTPANEARQGRITGTVFLRLKNQNHYAVRLTRFDGSLQARKPFDESRWITLGALHSESRRRLSAQGTEALDVGFEAPLLSLPDNVLLALQAITDPGKFRVQGSVVLEIADHPVEFTF